MVAEDDEMSKEKEIDKLMALISLSFKKIYRPTNNNLRTSSNTSRANQDNSLRINRGTRYDNQRVVNVAGARDNIDMSTNGEMADQDDDDLAKECDLLSSLIDKLKCEIKDFKTKNKSLESSNNHFKEANNKLSKTNQLMFKDLKKFQAELDRYHDVNYASKMEIDCAKAIGDLMSYKMESQNFVKPEFLKKAQRANPRLYHIGCINDNLALMLAPESDEMIRLAHKSRSKLNIFRKVRIYQKSQENSQKRANMNTGNGRAQEKPKIQSQSQKKSSFNQMGGKDNSSGQVHNGKEKNVILIGQVKQKITCGLEKVMERDNFALNSLREETQSRKPHGCHAGNPCELSFDPRAIIDDPMIG
ncbi:hypothetical protein Tco_1073156 [Tanacetum coccineum]